MNSNLMYHEVFELFEETEKRADKIAVLKKHGDKNFKIFLMYAMNPAVQFDVEIPSYEPSVDPAGLNMLYLHNEVNKLYRFIGNHPKKPANFSGDKQKNMLASILEALHKDEADLLVRCIKKDLRIPFLTPKLVKEAFPDIDLGAQ
jgi:hypothetical protein